MNHSLGQDMPTAPSMEELTQGRSSIVGLFESQVRSRTLATALEVNNKTFTYASLNQRAEWLARYLRTHGIGCRDIVALCLKRTENLIIGILGVLKTGAAYLPLNPGDPPLRLGQVLSHAASRFIVTDSQSMTNLPEVSSQVCVLDHQPVTATEEDYGGALYVPELTDLAYVIYTSGTTGSPKGRCCNPRCPGKCF